MVAIKLGFKFEFAPCNATSVAVALIPPVPRLASTLYGSLELGSGEMVRHTHFTIATNVNVYFLMILDEAKILSPAYASLPPHHPDNPPRR